jgi:hypothetical protein
MRECSYRIDADDRLRWVSSEWIAFAEENGGIGLDSGQILGRSLFDFVAGLETPELYRHLFTKVRRAGKPLSIPFRCDAPGVRGRMRMAIGRMAHGCMEIATTVSREEPREFVPLLDPEADRNAERIRMCSWCARVLLDADRWEEVEVTIELLGLFEGAALPRISHGACPSCRTTVMESTDDR